MDTYRKAAAMTGIAFKRWRYDKRIHLIFIAIGMIVMKELSVLTRYGLEQDGWCTFFVLPFLFETPANAVGSIKLFLYVGMLLLLCDAPFIDRSSPYCILRGRRRAWWISSCLYIAGTALIYTLFLVFLSMVIVFPVGIFSKEWGNIVHELSVGGAQYSLEMLFEKYHHMRFSITMVNYLYADAAWLYTIITVFLNFVLLGLLMYLISLFKRNRLYAIGGAAFFVFLDPFLYWLNDKRDKWYWYLSPVSWSSADATAAVDSNYILSPLPVIIASLILILLLVIGIAIKSKRFTIEVV